MRHRKLSGLVALALLSALAPIAAAAEEAGRDALAPGGTTGHYDVSGEPARHGSPSCRRKE